MDGNSELDKRTNKAPPPDKPMQEPTREDQEPHPEENFLEDSDLEDEETVLAQTKKDEWMTPQPDLEEEGVTVLAPTKKDEWLTPQPHLEEEGVTVLAQTKKDEWVTPQPGLEEEGVTVLAQAKKDEWIALSNHDREAGKNNDIASRELGAVDEASNLEDASDKEMAFKENYIPEDMDALESGGEEPWPNEEEPWPNEEEKDIGPLLPGMTPKAEPEIDQKETEEKRSEVTEKPPEVAAEKPPEVTVEKPPEVTEKLPELAKRSLKKKEDPPLAPILTKEYLDVDALLREEERKNRKRKTLKRAWAFVALLLLAMSLELVSQNEWWILTWYNLRSPYRLLSVESRWQKRSFGTLLLLQGEVDNNSRTRTVSSPPLVHISIMDKENKTLLTTQVVPGRVVNKKILNDSGEQAIREIIALHNREQTETESVWLEKKISFQALFINPPEGAVHFQVDFNVPAARLTKTGDIAARHW